MLHGVGGSACRSVDGVNRPGLVAADGQAEPPTEARAMPKWQIESRTSGVVLAVYEVPTEAAALDQMAQVAGYRDYAEVCEELAAPGDENSEIVITKLEG
jgi:hypothetical protein